MELTQELVKEIFEYRDGRLWWRHKKQGRQFDKPVGTWTNRNCYRTKWP